MLKLGNCMELIKDIPDNSIVGDTVLDPFMGINSTGLACKLLGRKSIGFEINKRYYDVAKERLMI